MYDFKYNETKRNFEFHEINLILKSYEKRSKNVINLNNFEI